MRTSSFIQSFLLVAAILLSAPVANARGHQPKYDLANSFPVTDGEKIKAMAAVKIYLEDNLKSPSSARYSDYGETPVRGLKGDNYAVAGWVDSQNSYGAMLRMKYIAIVKKSGEGRFRVIDFIN